MIVLDSYFAVAALCAFICVLGAIVVVHQQRCEIDRLKRYLAEEIKGSDQLLETIAKLRSRGPQAAS